MTKRDDVAKYVFELLTESNMETLGDQKDFCEKIADMTMRLQDFFGELPLPGKGKDLEIYEEKLEDWRSHEGSEQFAYAFADYANIKADELTWMRPKEG